MCYCVNHVFISIHALLLLLFSYTETKEELEEYEISSRELEAELEAQLEQQEGRVKELVASNQRLQMEVESLRVKKLYNYRQNLFGKLCNLARYKSMLFCHYLFISEKGREKFILAFLTCIEKVNYLTNSQSFLCKSAHFTLFKGKA